jgi:hypothetical protein
MLVSKGGVEEEEFWAYSYCSMTISMFASMEGLTRRAFPHEFCT